MAALPHADVHDSEFYKHIETNIPEPRRMRQLLTWCGTRALKEKPFFDSKDPQDYHERSAGMRKFEPNSPMTSANKHSTRDPTTAAERLLCQIRIVRLVQQTRGVATSTSCITAEPLECRKSLTNRETRKADSKVGVHSFHTAYTQAELLITIADSKASVRNGKPSLLHPPVQPNLLCHTPKHHMHTPTLIHHSSPILLNFPHSRLYRTSSPRRR